MPKTTHPTAGATHVEMLGVTLTVSAGPDKGVCAALEDGPLVVGTDPDCDVVLTDDTVSSRHCEFLRRGGRVVVRDLGSTNGVLVDGIAVAEAFPEPGSKIRIGHTQWVLKAAKKEDVLVSRADHFGTLYGKSAAMRALFAQVEAVAKAKAPLLLEGETGTGKDATAELVHQTSPRADGPFVVFDCGAVSASLLEAELFGNEKGAFTGATAARAGLAESAHGGTLVIDEVGELPLELQPKLLRLIERREVRRLGANDAKTIDVRIIACTHRSLRLEVKAKRFREDLFFRLSALRLRLPSLRERTEDIPGLVDAMLREHGSKRTFTELAPGDQALLLGHRWPGNVRELRNVVERLLAFPGAPELGLVEVHAQDPVSRADEAASLLPLSQARERSTDAFERRYLKDLLTRSQGSISEGARLASVSRQFLQRLLRKHGMR